jgi:hypothetical protein
VSHQPVDLGLLAAGLRAHVVDPPPLRVDAPLLLVLATRSTGSSWQ